MEETHGDHWSCVEMKTEEAFLDMVKNVAVNGVLSESVSIPAVVDGRNVDNCSVYALTLPYGDLASTVLLADSAQEPVLLAAFPRILDGEPFIGKLISVEEWHNGVEAVIGVEFDGRFKLKFYDVDYFVNKNSYAIGQLYEFSIGALAYRCELAPQMNVTYEGQQALQMSRIIGSTPRYDANGNPQPVVMNLKNVVSFLSTNNNYPDDAQFKSPASAVSEVEAFGVNMWKTYITIHRDKNARIQLPLYIRKDVFCGQPQLDDALNGIIWIQGRMNRHVIADLTNRPVITRPIVDSQGQPRTFRHNCPSHLTGTPMSYDDMHSFAVQVLAQALGTEATVMTKVGTFEPDILVGKKAYLVIPDMGVNVNKVIASVDVAQMVHSYYYEGYIPVLAVATANCLSTANRNHQALNGEVFYFDYHYVSILPDQPTNAIPDTLSHDQLVQLVAESIRMSDSNIIEPYLDRFAYLIVDDSMNMQFSRCELMCFIRGVLGRNRELSNCMFFGKDSDGLKVIHIYNDDYTRTINVFVSEGRIIGFRVCRQ